MGTGWRRAFCTSDPESTINTKHRTHSPTPSPRSCVSLGFLSTPSLHHHHEQQQQQQQQPLSSTPKGSRCETITEQTNYHSPRIFQTKTKQNPTSPLSPKLKLSLFKNSFKFRSSCGICLNSVKTGQGTAIYTAECGHAFHFPCVVSHARSHVCPVCDATWNDVPYQQNDVAVHTVPTEKRHKQPIHHHSDSITSYNDDEPLPSPLTTQIVPIPEADENTEEENDDVGEFPGFFVDPKPHSSLRQNGVVVADSRTVRVKLMPECAVISVSQSHKTYAVVLRVKAPPPSPRRRRPPMDLVTVLDVSNGMSGAKLHMLKRAMRLVISSLGAADRLAVVASSANYSKRLIALRRMTAEGQLAARRVVDRLVCGQGNSVGEEAMKKAAKVLEDRRERNPLAKILLLSDGHDNNNIIQQRWLSHVSFSRFSCVEVPVRSFGFGTLKTGLTHEPLEDTFSQYITEILCVAVQDLRIQLGFSAPGEIRAVYSCSGGPTALKSNAARLGDLYAEEEKELLVEVRVPTTALGSHHEMTVRCVNRNPSCEEFVYGAEHVFTVVPPNNTTSRFGDRVERLRNVFITSRAVAESRRLAKQNKFSSAHHLLASAQALLMQLGSAEEYIRGLEAELVEVEWRKQQHETVVIARRRKSEREVRLADEFGDVLTPTSAWRAAEKLAKMAMVKKSLNKVSDLHGFENARF